MGRSPENARIPIRTRVLRSLVATSTSLPFRTEAPKPKSEGWKRAEELNASNYGIIIAHMHANKGDAPRVIRRAFISPILGKRDILLPNSAHQFKDWYIPAGDQIRVKVLPIFTSETNRLAQEDPVLAKRLKDKYGIDMADPQLSRRMIANYATQYVDEAVLLLQKAGVTIVAPQGHREGTLTTMTTAVETILARAQRQDIHNIAVLFLGYEMPGVDNYNEVPSYNLFKKYQFRDGRCLTIDELLAKASGNTRQLKDIVRKEMEAVVPPAYLPQPNIRDFPQSY